MEGEKRRNQSYEGKKRRNQSHGGDKTRNQSHFRKIHLSHATVWYVRQLSKNSRKQKYKLNSLKVTLK